MRNHLRALVPSLLAVCALSAADTSYLVPMQGGVIFKPIATAGDAFPTTPTGTQVFAGIPDGLGAFDNSDGTFTLLVNHEIPNTNGVVRAHGGKGAFVGAMTINKTTLAVTKSVDLITSVWTATRSAGAPTFATTTGYTFNRFCSADLANPTAFYNANSGKGVPVASGRLFLNGEEGTGGRAFAHIASGALVGNTIELPHLGRFAFENNLGCPTAQDKTIVISQDDTSPGFVTVYVGDKQILAANPTPVDIANAAGLTNGKLYVIKANGLAAEDRTTAVGGAKGASVPFSLVALGNAGDVSSSTYADTTATGATAALRTDAAAKGTLFLRPEDGCWDTVNAGTYYFVTTDRLDDTKNGLNGQTTNGSKVAAPAPQVGRSRLWKLVFSSIATPETGGTITCLIDGTENPGPQMMDNMSIDARGRIMLQEDPGGTADFSARVWAYETSTGKLTVIAKHDPANNGDLGLGSPVINGGLVAPTTPFNRDEESSGVMDAEAILGAGWWLMDVQNHSATGQTVETFEGGQLLAMYVPPTYPTGATIQTGRMATFGNMAVRDSGWGSAIATVPGTTDQVYLMSDRGPNIDGTPNADGSVTAKLFPVPGFNPRIGRFKLNGDGTTDLLEIIGLKRADGTPLTGLPLPAGQVGATGETGYALKADGTADTVALTDAEGIDSEGLVAMGDGSFWISDEYGPFLLNVGPDGRTIERVKPGVANLQGHKLPAVLARRLANKGMEGLTLTPDGTKLVGIMQAALVNGVTGTDFLAADSSKCPSLRIVVYTLATGAVQEYVYLLDDPATFGGAVSEITAISNTTFLVDERDGKFLSEAKAKIKKVYKIDISGATNINDANDAATGKLFAGGAKTLETLTKAMTTAAATTALAAESVIPVTKSLAVDLLTTVKTSYNHDKIEGIVLKGSTLWIANDDDFGVNSVTTAGVTSIIPKNVDGTTVGSSNFGEQDFSQVLGIDLSGQGISLANYAPSIAPIPNLPGMKPSTLQLIARIGDVETQAASLTFSATSSNPAIVAVGSPTILPAGPVGSLRALVLTKVGSLGTATITLTAGDGTTSTTSTFTVTVAADPNSSVTGFIERFYTQVLGRAPETAGLDDWSAKLQANSHSGAALALGFLKSQEFKNRTLTNAEYVKILYRAFFGREPDAGGEAGWLTQLNAGAQREDIANGFLFAPEFSNFAKNANITAVTAADAQRKQSRDFVRRFYVESLGREPDTAGGENWHNALVTGAVTGATFTDAFITSPEFVARNLTDDQFLAVLYKAYFNRVGDAGGLAGWKAALVSGTTRKAVAASFARAQEFIQLCATYGITPFSAGG